MVLKQRQKEQHWFGVQILRKDNALTHVEVILNAGIAAWTEHKAGDALEALSKMTQAAIYVTWRHPNEMGLSQMGCVFVGGVPLFVVLKETKKDNPCHSGGFKS